MKSRTSFFNFTVFRKNITRFAPVWALYTIFLILIFFSMGFDYAQLAWDLNKSIGPMIYINFAYAGICAFFLFGDLFNSRLCNALHAFPMRREGWLLTNVASGVLFSVGPNLIVGLLGCTVLREYFYMSFIWQAASLLQFLFFFGTAVLSALCAGNRLAMVAIYSIIHFITVLIYGVWELLYQPLLYGVQVSAQKFYKFFPLYRLMECEYLDCVRYSQMSGLRFEFINFIAEGWVSLGLCTGVGVVCMVLAWRVYRRRQLESAGDFISLRHLSPVFLTIYTIGVGAVLYMFGELFGGLSDLFLIVGLVVGYFTGRMLLGRTLRVFNKKSLIGFVVFLIAFAGSMGLTKLDPLGVASYIPDADSVQGVAVYDSAKSHIYRSNYYSFAYTQKEDIIQVQDLHQQLLLAGDPGKYDTVEVEICYTLKSGKEINRYYRVNTESEVGEQTMQCLSDMRYLFQAEDIKDLDKQITYVMVDTVGKEDVPRHFSSKDADWIAGLLDAIQADSKDGTLGLQWYYGSDNISVEFQFADTIFKDEQGENQERYPYCNIYISKNCTNTYAYLQAAFALGKEEIP